MLPIAWLKLLAAIGLFFVAFLPAVLPAAILHRRRVGDSSASKSSKRNQRRILSALSCFGAGVFLAVFFLDMLPEVRAVFDEWYEATQGDGHYPLPELGALAGFLLVLIVEQVALTLHQVTARGGGGGGGDGAEVRRVERAESHLSIESAKFTCTCWGKS